MLDVLKMNPIGVRGQQETIGPSNSIEIRPLSMLLVETDRVQRSQREWLLRDPVYCVTVVFGVREFFLLHANSIALALLSDSIGRSALRDVAESVRQRWPKAKILVLGRAWPALDDDLYDDEIGHNSQEKEIRDVIKKLIPTFPGHAFVQQEMD